MSNNNDNNSFYYISIGKITVEFDSRCTTSVSAGTCETRYVYLNWNWNGAKDTASHAPNERCTHGCRVEYMREEERLGENVSLITGTEAKRQNGKDRGIRNTVLAIQSGGGSGINGENDLLVNPIIDFIRKLANVPSVTIVFFIRVHFIIRLWSSSTLKNCFTQTHSTVLRRTEKQTAER